MINDSYANNNFNELNHISVSKSNEKGQIYNNLIRNNSLNIDNNFKRRRTGSTSSRSNNGHKKIIINNFKKSE